MPKHLPPTLRADILIIDDTPDNLRLLKQILSKDYKVRLAPGGMIGLTAARSMPPDLILLDVMMPDMDGYAVAAQLKAAEQTEEIPIIFISALDDAESKVRGFAVGGVDYVTKPFQEKEVLARVKTHLSLRALYRQAQAELAERKRVEDILRQREHEFSTLVENATDMIVRFDTDLRHIYCNPAVERQLGVPASAFLGKTVLESSGSSEQAKIAHQALQKVLETGLGQDVEQTYTTPFGTKHFHTHVVPERSPKGRIESLLAITRNITERKQAEEKLQEREAFLNTLLDAIPIPIFYKDRDGRYMGFNRAYETFLGETRERLLGKTVFEIHPAQLAEIYQIQDEKLFEVGGVQQYESLVKNVRGDLRDVILYKAVFVDGQGAIGGLIGTILDITERKQTEEALRASNAKLETLFRVSPLAITLLNASGDIQLWNPAAEQIFGWTAQEVVGRPNPIVPASEQNEYISLSSQVIHGRVLDGFETVRQRKDGSLVDVSISSAPVNDADGMVAGRMAIIADITEHKKMEQSLLQRNQEMATLYEISLEINALTDPSVLLNAILQRACALLNIPSGVLYMVNPQEETIELVVGHQVPANWIGKKIGLGEGLVGQVVLEKKPLMVDDYQAWGNRLNAFSDSPARRVLGVPLKIHDDVTGAIVLIDKQVGSFSEEEIRLVNLFAGQAAIAVTNAQFAAQLEQRVVRRTEELATAIKELESISYTVSHDLRSPLRAVVGYSHIIRSEYAESLPPEIIRLLGLMSDNAQFMGSMIDGLLRFMQFSRKTLKVQDIQPAHLVKEALNLLLHEQKGRKVEIVVHELAACQGDRALLLDVWYNLLSNALKFSRPRETALVEIGCLADKNNEPVFYVKDNGVGFEMRYSDNLFKVFHRLHYPEEFEGIGLGLALTQRIISRHGGHIWAEAEKDKGAVFYFTVGIHS